MKSSITPEEYREKYFWRVKLSNDEVFYGIDENDSIGNEWLKLKEYVENNHLRVTEYSINFRDHSEDIIREEKIFFGVFFNNAIYGDLLTNEHYFNTGVITSEKFVSMRWKVPELMPMNEIERDLNKEWDRSCSILFRS